MKRIREFAHGLWITFVLDVLSSPHLTTRRTAQRRLHKMLRARGTP